jgi:hypothetical protein
MRFGCQTGFLDWIGANPDLKIHYGSLRGCWPTVRALRHTRNHAGRRLAGILTRFAKGVCAHPGYGDDSPFYRALGFVPHSEIRSGRPRKPRATS